MNKINVLDPSIYNLISAGEVAVNPAGVIKELVENSLDASATKITIEVWGAGKEKIKVTDNGVGIASSQVKLAFLPHATSKISKVEDIYNISTLGFRGEALASICNVSKLSILTRTEDEDVGTYLEIDAGKTISESEKASNIGTEIIVSNLFYNTPARLKFLGTDKAEQREISKVVENLMLANPSIEFAYYIDGKLSIKTSSGSLEKTILEVVGSKFLNSTFPIEAKTDKYSLKGYAVLPTDNTQSRFMRCYINGRVTNNQCISSAIMSAYAEYTMKNFQPSFIVFFDLPYDEVDVNITPQKTDVKFQNDYDVFSWVSQQTKEAMLNHITIENKVLTQEELEKEVLKRARYEDNDGNVVITDDVEPKQASANTYKIIQTIASSADNKNLNEIDFYSKFKQLKDVEEQNISNQIENERIENEKRAEQIKIFSFEDKESEETANQLKSDSEIMQSVKNYRNSPIISDNKNDEDMAKTMINSVKQEMTQISFLKNKYKVLGVIFSTYILVQMEDAFIIIDQHAAHERYLYDKFMGEIGRKDIEIQELMLPFTLSVDNDRAKFLDDNLQVLNDLGFKIETFGNNFYKVESVPLILSDMDLEYFFDMICDSKMYITGFDEQLKEKIAMKACKSAIKAGMTLSDSEIEHLIEMIKTTKSPLLCPHGRPYCLKILKSDIEKWFKRIV